MVPGVVCGRVPTVAAPGWTGSGASWTLEADGATIDVLIYASEHLIDHAMIGGLVNIPLEPGSEVLGQATLGPMFEERQSTARWVLLPSHVFVNARVL